MTTLIHLLHQILNFSRTHWKVTLIFLIVLILLITGLIRVLTPPIANPVIESPLIKTNFDDTTSDLSKITYTGNKLTPPEKIKIVKTTPGSNLATVGNTIITNLNLSKTEEGVWENDEWTLLYIEIPGFYELIRKNQTNTLKIVSKTESIQVAQNFVSTTLQVQNLSYVDQYVEFFAGTEELEPTNEFKANIMRIPFSYTVDGYPVYVERQGALPITTMINSNNQVIKVTIRELPFTFSSIQEATPISVDQAVKNMNSKNVGSILSASNRGLATPDLVGNISGNLKSVIFEYRYDGASQAIYPFYRFFGSLKEANGESFNAELITPAI